METKYYDEEYRDAICYTDPATEKFDRDGDGVVCYVGTRIAASARMLSDP